MITPIGIALGVICYSFFNANSPPTILAIGVLDSISAGLLIYGATVDLLAKDFFMGDGGLADASDKRVAGAILSMLLGAMVSSKVFIYYKYNKVTGNVNLGSMGLILCTKIGLIVKISCYFTNSRTIRDFHSIIDIIIYKIKCIREYSKRVKSVPMFE